MLSNIEKKILELKEKGYTPKEIEKELNLSRHFVYYRYKESFKDILERRKAKNASNEKFERLVQKYLPESNSLNHLCSKLGIRSVEGYYVKIKKIIDKYNLDTAHFGTIKINSRNNTCDVLTDDDFFVEGSNRKGHTILKRLILHGYKEWKCENEECGRSEWLGDKIPLQVHHINGNHYDNRLENLQLLCPNCHAKTDNFCKKNKSNKEKYCLNCGKELLFCNQNKFCSNKCHHEYYKTKANEEEKNKKMEQLKFATKNSIEKRSKLKNITKSELIESFKEKLSFVKVGEFYNVSDNAIRKLCSKYGLPIKRKEMERFLLDN